MSQNEFDNEMKKMGVTRTGGAEGKPKTVRIARSSTAPAGSGGRAAKARAAQAPPTPDPALVALQAELEGVQGKLEAAEASVQTLTEALATAESEQEDAVARSASLLAELQEPVEGSVSLKEALFQRGVLGADEQRRAFEGLFKRGKWEGILPMLRVDRPKRLQERLNEDLFLFCGTGDCKAPKSAVWLNVVPERCEVCGGADWNAGSVSDALLLNGYRVVILYGGHPHQQNLLRAALDSRIRFRAAPAAQATQTPPANAGELRIYWTGTRSDPVAEFPDHPACVPVSEANLAGFVRAVVYELGRR